MPSHFGKHSKKPRLGRGFLFIFVWLTQADSEIIHLNPLLLSINFAAFDF